MEIFKNVKSLRKVMENGNITQKMTFWPNAKCDSPGNILMHMRRTLFCAQGWVLKDDGISLFYHEKVMEKSWNLKAQKEHEPWQDRIHHAIL